MTNEIRSIHERNIKESNRAIAVILGSISGLISGFFVKNKG